MEISPSIFTNKLIEAKEGVRKQKSIITSNVQQQKHNVLTTPDFSGVFY